jgi:chromosome segregation ATPase
LEVLDGELARRRVWRVSGSCEGRTFFLDPCGLAEPVSEGEESAGETEHQHQHEQEQQQQVKQLKQQLKQQQQEQQQQLQQLKQQVQQLQQQRRSAESALGRSAGLARRALAELRRRARDKSAHALAQLLRAIRTAARLLQQRRASKHKHKHEDEK